MKADALVAGKYQKAAAGWFNGCNSVRNPWLLPDSQYVWGVNVVNRGGIVQTRPGNRLRLTLPDGNLQGMTFFSADKDGNTVGECLVFVVDGKVYYAPFPLVQPTDWSVYQIKSLSFSPLAKQVFFCDAERLTDSSSQTISITAKHRILMIQDGIMPAAYWDGITASHLSEQDPDLQTPRGSWMVWAGQRLWVARGNAVIGSDLGDPLSFRERTSGTGRGDPSFPSDVTGLGTTLAENRQTNLVVFTQKSTHGILSSILDREQWAETPNFVYTLYSDLGCIAGKSVVNHAGLLWWYSPKGLVANDSAASAFITSQIRFKDTEMAITKRNLASNLTGICAASFESYLMISVPSGDELNAHTMVLDNAIADELTGESAPAWNGIWTGFRPIEWAKGYIDDEERIFFASVDYQALPGSTSFNHIWEAFQSNRADTVQYIDSNGVEQVVSSQIYCSFLTKYFGDGLDLKAFDFAEGLLVELGGTVNFKISAVGITGPAFEIFKKQYIATTDPASTSNSEVQELYVDEGPFKVQSRRFKTRGQHKIDLIGFVNVESDSLPTHDTRFALYFEWCGRAGVDSFRIWLKPVSEKDGGDCQKNETGINVVTSRGTQKHYDE